MPFAHHVGLIVESARHRDVGDAARGAQEQPARVLEPENPRGSFRRDAELADEALAEVSPAESDVAGELANWNAPTTQPQASPGPSQVAGHLDRAQPSQEHTVDDCKALCPGRRTVHPVEELVAHAPADVVEVDDPRGHVATADPE